jgi:hypothetical protein
MSPETTKGEPLQGSVSSLQPATVRKSACGKKTLGCFVLKQDEHLLPEKRKEALDHVEKMPLELIQLGGGPKFRRSLPVPNAEVPRRAETLKTDA